MAKRPNILFIISDQHNAKVLGCKGHPHVQTPSFDRVAAQGVRFDNCISQNPICTPSEPFWSWYEEDKLTFQPNIDHDMLGNAPHLRDRNKSEGTGEWTVFEPRTWEAGLRRKLHGYLGCVSQVDHATGELLEWLITRNRPVTGGFVGPSSSYQTFTRHHVSVNLDGKINPEYLRQAENRTYI